MSGYWLFTPLLLPLFFGGLALPWLEWRDSGTLRAPSPGGWLALLVAVLLLSSLQLGGHDPLQAWLGAERPLARALPAVWAFYGLPCWAAAVVLYPAALARRWPGQPSNRSMAEALVTFAGWGMLLVAGLVRLVVG
jgi:hypothetical protein